MSDTEMPVPHARPPIGGRPPAIGASAEAMRAPARWRDGDTMLSFGIFAAIVLMIMAHRISDPTNWVHVSVAGHHASSCDVGDE